MAYDPMFFMPAVEGLEIPPWFHDYMGTLGTSLDYAFRNLGQEISDPSTTTIETHDSGNLTLEEISDFLPRRGTVWAFHGSWSDAASMPGWAICDGSNGTPQYHPAIDDASPVQRILRATAYGTDSGTTAGAATHSHTTCLTSSAAGIHNHSLESSGYTSDEAHCHTLLACCSCTTCDPHCHGVCGATCCSGHCHDLDCCACTRTDGCHCHGAGTLATEASYCSACSCCGTDHTFSCCDHTHGLTGCTDCNTHCHGVTGSTCCNDHCHTLDACCSETTCDCHCHGIQGVTCEDEHCHELCGCTCCAAAHSHTLGCQVTSSDAHLPQVIDVIWLMKL